MTTYNNKTDWWSFDSEVNRQGPAIRKAYMSALVQFLINSSKFSQINVLEVGSWAGASTIAWAHALKKASINGSVHCVDLWKPYFDLDVNEASIYKLMNALAETGEIFEEFQRNISRACIQDMVSYTIGNSKEVLPQIESDHYQIVFIDASHKYEDVLFDIKEAKRIVTDGGVLCGDDFELAASAADPVAHNSALIKGVDYLVDPKTLTHYHPGVSEAISEMFEYVSSKDGFWAVRRHGDSWEHINLTSFKLIVPEHLKKTAPPEIIFSEFGFNIVEYRNLYFVCHMSIGNIDFIENTIDKLQRIYPSDLFVIEESLWDARHRIHLLEISRLNKLLNQS